MNVRVRETDFQMLLLYLALILLSGCTINNNQVNLQVFLQNLSVSYNAITRLVTAWAYLTGIVFGAIAIFQLKVYGEMRTMMSGHANLFKPIMYLIVSVILMYLPSTFQSVMKTTFGSASTSPLSWSSVSSVGMYGYKLAITPALLGLMRLVGLISFVRGWILLVRISEQGQHGSFGKAITHILGGLLLINVVAVGNILSNLAAVG